MSDALSRSCFHLVATKQWIAAMERQSWEATAACVDMAKEHTRGIISSVIVEDMLKHQKNTGQVKGSRRMRRPQRSMAVAIGNGLVEERYRYTAPKSEAFVGRKLTRLATSCFGVPQPKATIDVSGIATASSSPNYFSPTACNIGKPAADLPLLQLCRQMNSSEPLENTDFGAMSNPQHPFVFKGAFAGRDPDQWYVGLGHYPGSSALAWPVRLSPAPSAMNDLVVEFQTGLARPIVLPIVSWEGIKARATAWRS